MAHRFWKQDELDDNDMSSEEEQETQLPVTRAAKQVEMAESSSEGL